MIDLFDKLIYLSESLSKIEYEILSRIKPSTDLIPSTWSGEERWYKFIVLSDGSVIPCKSSHMETVAGVVDKYTKTSDPSERANWIMMGEKWNEFVDSGGISGRFDSKIHELNIYGKSRPNERQISSIVSLAKKHRVVSLALEIGDEQNTVPIKSFDQIGLALRHGVDMLDEPVDERTFDLHDHLFEININSGDVAGFIMPDGFIEVVPRGQLHFEYAANKLGLKPDPHSANNEIIKQYCEQNNYVRFYFERNETSIQIFSKITLDQLKVIYDFAMKSGRFVYDIMGSYGKSYNQFLELLESKNLIIWQ